MNLYAQAITDVKRKAQSRLVSMLLDENPQNEGTAAIGTKRKYEKIIEARKLSGRTPGNLLKLGGMDSTVRHFQEPSEPLIGRLLEQRSEVLWSQFHGTRTSDNSRISP